MANAPSTTDGRGVSAGPAQPMVLLNPGDLPGGAGGAPIAVSIDQTTPGTTNKVSVTNAGGFNAALTTIRPANQTPYTANDVVGGAMTFPTMGPNAGRILLTSVQLEIDIAAIPAGMTSFNLYLYSVTPPSAIADNSPFDIPAGDRASFLGKIAMGTPVDEGSTLYIEVNIVNKQIKLAGTSIFAYLATVGGFTPGAVSEVYVVTLHGVAL